MKKTPKVSVLMPVYNPQEKHLRGAIESILKQTFRNFELIIVNDGSTNNAEDVILSYKDKRIVYYKQENMGIAKTRNRLFELGRGEYFAIMDNDDISLPERLQKQVEVLDKNQTIGVVGGWIEQFDCRSGISRFIEKPRVLDFYFYGNQIANPCAMLRRNFFEKYGLRYDDNYPPAEDFDLWSRAAKYMDFYNIQEVLLKYRWHTTNQSIVNGKKQKDLAQKVQNNILKSVVGDAKLRRILELTYAKINRPKGIWNRIFSVRNVRLNEQKYKLITILFFSFLWSKK